MHRSLFTNPLFGMALATTIGACASPDLSPPCPVPPGATAEQQAAAKAACYGGTLPKVIDTRLHKDVDILFVIDNSPSMAPKQKVLGGAIKSFISAIDGFGANYHVGIVTTDLGYNPQPNTGTAAPWNTLPTCNTYSGDDGVLQNIPCTNRGLTGEAAAACTGLCPDPKYVPSNGARYISKVDGVTNVPISSATMDQGPLLAFQCMALVGDIGCGVEQPLESAKRALDNHRPDNAGFNRNSSVLAVIFITDEDDCSVQLAQRNLMNPLTPGASTKACTDPNQSGADPQCFNVDYRCLARSLSCTEPMNTKGSKTNCAERKDSFLYPIDQYANFFNSLPNPNLIIAGIWTPTILDNLASVPTPAKDGQLVIDYVNGTMDSAGLNRGRKNLAACYNADPTLTTDVTNGFFGQAQLRMSTFIRRFQKTNTSESSICGAAGQTVSDSYASALGVVASNINNAFNVDCLTVAPKTANGNPQCLVGYVDASNPNSTPDATLPVCSAKCCNYFATDPQPNKANDPNLMPNTHLQAEQAACSADVDCYCAVPSKVNCGTGAVAGLWRKGSAAPPSGKVVNFQCAVPVSGS